MIKSIKGFVVAGFMGLAATGGMPGNAEAAIVNVTYSGQLVEVGAFLGSAFAVGDTFSSSFQFDTLTPDTHPELALGGYFGFGSNFTTNIDGRELTATSADGFVSNNRFGSDLFLVRAQNLSPDVIASAIGPFSLARLEFRMDDIDEEVFSDTALPLTTPPLNLFEEAGFFADYRTDSGFSNIVRGTVDQIAFEIIDDVPEPASLTLIGAGLFGLGMMRRRYKKAKTV